MQPRSEPNGRVESAGGTSDGRAGLVYVVSNDPVLCENSAASEREQFRGASWLPSPLGCAPSATAVSCGSLTSRSVRRPPSRAREQKVAGLSRDEIGHEQVRHVTLPVEQHRSRVRQRVLEPARGILEVSR